MTSAAAAAAAAPRPPENIANAWILDFVLRQPVPDSLALALLKALPLPSPPPQTLKKAILLRRLSSDLSRRSLSDRTLHTLELIEDLDRLAPSAAMQTAYCAVTVYFTLESLRRPGGDFPKVVERIWHCRLADIERSEARGLVSDEVSLWRRLMELALTDPDTREMLLRRDTEKEAVEAVGDYLKEAMVAMGPPLLELAASRIGNPLQSAQSNDHRGDGASTQQDASEQDGCSSCKVDRWPTPVVNKVAKDLKTSCADLLMAVRDPLPDAVVVASRLTEATEVDELQENHDKVDMNELGDDLRNTEAPQGNHCEVEVNELVGHAERGDEVLCAKGSDAGTVQGKDDGALQPPHDADPLPHSKVLDGNGNSVAVKAPEQSVGGGTDVTHKEGTSTGTERHKPSLMDRNPTAHTYEWDDSIDSPYESSPKPSNILRLSSPKRRVISPLKLIENKKINRRRRVKKWSLLEEDTLRDAVKKYGAGNWKNILSNNSEIFEERTEVDLKDKWRNMTKH